jgi:hypothetical protein
VLQAARHLVVRSLGCSLIVVLSLVSTSLADHKPVFDNGKWNSFLKAFKQKFEPISASMEAKNKLYNLRQGKRSFASLELEFNT